MDAATIQAPENSLHLREERKREHERNRARNLREQLLQWAQGVPLLKEGERLEDAAGGDLKALQEQAVEDYNHQHSRGNEHLRIRPEVVDDRTMNRWCVNFLRHRHTLYDRRANRIGNHPRTRARTEAMRIIQNRTYLLIMKAWPHLAQECRKQMQMREDDRGDLE